MIRDNLKIAVIIPCYNESLTIKNVVKSFKVQLPTADIFVFDNNSTDGTTEIAKEAGAITRFVPQKGKGNVVRRMFADVDADIYVLVDGDMTYDPKSAPIMVNKLIDDNDDMIVGVRCEKSKDNNNYRPGHRLGNKIFTTVVQKMFGGNFTDMLSGYRVFSKRFVKSFIVKSKGFEIETELTVHTLELNLPYEEVKTDYSERPSGSSSKLSTYKDGFKILFAIARLYSNEKPKDFWSIIGSILFIIAFVFIVPIVAEFTQTHLVPRFPTFILSIGLFVCSFLSFSIGFILQVVAEQRRETAYFFYLSSKKESEK